MTILIISGVTCSGKSHLIDALKNAGIARIVTVTTRDPRQGEINGRDYKFISVDEFNAIEQSGDFAETNEFSGAKYGTVMGDLFGDSIKAVIVDPNGHRNIKARLKKESIPYLSVFLDADPTLQAGRFLNRCHDEVNQNRSAGRFPQVAIRKATLRLSDMLSIEAHWRDVARCKESPYDMVVESYDAQNQEEILQTIIERAKAAAGNQ